MSGFSILQKSPYFMVGHGLNQENASDNKVAMLSEVNMAAAVRLRRRLEQEAGVKPSYTALVVKAVSLALRRHAHVNRIAVGLWRKKIVQLHQVDVSVAVERDRAGREQAVFVGTIRDTDRRDLAAITGELRDLAHATPETCPRWALFRWLVETLPTWLTLRIVSLPRWFVRLWIEHRGGAVLISSPTKYGVDAIIGVWPWPVGFSFGYVKDRPMVEDGSLVVRPSMTLTMSFDRRLLGGAPAARFLAAICQLLEDAELCLAEPPCDSATPAVDASPWREHPQ